AIARGDLPEGYVVTPDYKPARQGDVRDSLADVSAARALIGYEPKVSLKEGLARTYAAFREFTTR
ncbi:hypothetical protein EON77_13645, partial [bacterium]